MDVNDSSNVKFLKEHEKAVEQFEKTLVNTHFPTVRQMYFDLTALKDTRLGTVLALTGTKYEAYINQHIERYNRRLHRNFLEGLSDIPYTEEQLDSLWRNPKFANDIFDLSPDTDVGISIDAIVNGAIDINDRIGYNSAITIYINTYPLIITKNIINYSKILQKYLTSRVNIKLISEDPHNVPTDVWRNSYFIFLDSMEPHSVETSTLYTVLYLNRELINANIYAPIDISEKQEELIKSKGYDIHDNEQLSDLMNNTKSLLDMWCTFYYCPYLVPSSDINTQGGDTV